MKKIAKKSQCIIILAVLSMFFSLGSNKAVFGAEMEIPTVLHINTNGETLEMTYKTYGIDEENHHPEVRIVELRRVVQASDNPNNINSSDDSFFARVKLFDVYSEEIDYRAFPIVRTVEVNVGDLIRQKAETSGIHLQFGSGGSAWVNLELPPVIIYPAALGTEPRMPRIPRD